MNTVTTPILEVKVQATFESTIKIKEGSNAKMGTATLVDGTATVSTTAVTANSRIFLTPQTMPGPSPFAVGVSARTAGTSFTITSGNGGDMADVAWLILEPSS